MIQSKLTPVKDVTSIKSGQLIRIHQKIKELTTKGEEKERIQIFEGMVIGRRGGKGMGATITVRKISDGVGVEKIFPLHLPTITNIELVKEYQTKKAQLPYLRLYTKKLKEKTAISKS